ncbi:hypothetical protein KEM54_006403 [Ascosphaera aggregata]|nr:hypothetical protein KEM54_006403 [Ascosphaera aggregata]
MTLSSAARRSTRRRKAVRYTAGPLESAEVEEHDAVAASAADDGDEASWSGSSEYGDAVHDVDKEEGSDELDASGDEDAVSIGSTSVQTSGPNKGIKRKRLQSRPQFGEDNPSDEAEVIHSRGLGKENALHSKSFQIKTSYGPFSDLLPICLTRDLWSGPMDVTFPSKKTLNKLLNGPPSEDPLWAYEQKLSQEAREGWGWYVSDLGAKFLSKQKMSVIPESEGRSYLPARQALPMGVLVGPRNSEQHYHLHVGESVDFGNAFPKRVREGWVLNMGNKIQCMSWCPNIVGAFQYLAIAAPVLDHQRADAGASQRPANAFTASPPHPAAIQIWGFATTGSNGKGGLHKLDMKIKPRLIQVICTKAGDIRRLAWCQAPRDWEHSKNNNANGAYINIGLLGGVWSDGTVKVFDVNLRSDIAATDGADYVMAQSPAFEVRLAKTLCTCFAWLSPSNIIIGHSDGSIAVWSLVTELKPNRPAIYTPLHTTYIVNIESAYPVRPDLIVTMAMDGQMRLISLLDLKSDLVDYSRSRVVSPCLSFSPPLMSFITADEVDIVRLFPIRRFFSPISAARTYGALSAIAPGSIHHPISLFANVGGAVMASNPLARTMHAKGKHWQQIWFSHTWVASSEDSDKHPGTVRFIDGFKAEVPSLLRNVTVDSKAALCMTNVTIFEEKTAVTAVSWNPNRGCAGWAAAGMGSGLLRVEDLSI